MRNRAFRRYMEEVKVIKRIKERGRSYYRGYRDCNDIKFQSPIWVNKIGSDDHFNFKIQNSKIIFISSQYYFLNFIILFIRVHLYHRAGYLQYEADKYICH